MGRGRAEDIFYGEDLAGGEEIPEALHGLGDLYDRTYTEEEIIDISGGSPNTTSALAISSENSNKYTEQLAGETRRITRFGNWLLFEKLGGASSEWSVEGYKKCASAEEARKELADSGL